MVIASRVYTFILKLTKLYNLNVCSLFESVMTQ